MERQMKDSGFQWLGMVPKDWNVERLQWHLREINEKNNPIKTDFVLSLTKDRGVIPYEEKGAQGNISKENHSEYKLAFPDTIVANSMNVIIGSVGYCNYFGCVSPVYYVFMNNEKNDLRFFNYLFQTAPFQKLLRNYANGILEIRLRLSAMDILKRMIAVPSYDEQQLIANFLDTKCAQIDDVSKKIQEEIDTLEEYKKAVITEAVTKGLNPNVEMKESGIQALGKVPDKWNVIRLKYVADSIRKGSGITKEQVFPEGDTPCVRYGEIYSKYNISFNKCFSNTFKEKLSSLQWFGRGDILFAGTGELIEEIGKNIVYEGTDNCLAGGDIIIVSHSQDAAFLNFALCSECSQKQKSAGKSKLKVVHISASEIGNLYIALPKIEEQRKIGEYLKEKCSSVEKAIFAKQQQLSILEEYKKSLIYEYVTGKKEVKAL